MRSLLLAACLVVWPGWASAYAFAQTRLYFPASTAAAISPAASADWNDASEIERRERAHTKGSSAVGIGQTVDILEDQANYQDLDRQYITTQMQSGVVFTSGATTITSYIQMREFAATDDVTQCILGVRVLSEDGSTVRATLLALANYGTAVEFNSAAVRNKQCANGDTLTGSYTTVSNDRLVVEVGYQTDGAETTPQAAANWGENASDCAQNEVDTAACAGWVEFSNTISFVSVARIPTLSLGVW